MNGRQRKAAIHYYEKICKLLEVPLGNETADTPRRFICALEEMTSSAKEAQRKDTKKMPVEFKKFAVSSGQCMVVSRNIDFVALCEHHHMPFVGTLAFGYLPNKYVVGMSKVPRFVEWLSKYPTMQETFTSRVADTIDNAIDPLGVCVCTRAIHTCVCGRGPKARRFDSVVYAIRGQDGAEIKDEILALIKS